MYEKGWNAYKRYIELTIEGDKTIHERLELFKKQKQLLETKLKSLQHALEVLDFKCWYYETAEEAGTVDVPQNMSLEDIPKKYQHIRKQLTNLPDIF